MLQNADEITYLLRRSRRLQSSFNSKCNEHFLDFYTAFENSAFAAKKAVVFDRIDVDRVARV